MQNRCVAIAIPADPEHACAVLRQGRRIATSFGLRWIALRVKDRRAALSRNLEDLVERLGGRLVFIEGNDVPKSLIELSCREQARLLVIGRSRRPRVVRWLVRGTTERILGASRPFDVVVTGEER